MYVGPEENAPPPLSQTQVQFPIIDDLADDFALLIVVLKRELRSLSDSQLQDVKELVEEKLKSKRISITIPSSAVKLISTISQYWNFLSFEIVQLVVRHLGKKELHEQLQTYEENLQKKAEVLLTQCKKENITPRAPPGCFSMTITVDEDPYSFSLQRILEIKDFLVHRIGMDIALFTGFHLGSIILHFCILEDDMETAVHQLNVHKLELRAMQVVAIEVGDVIVYRNAPIERPPSIAAVSSQIDDLAVATETGGPIPQSINDLANTVEVGSPVVSKLQEFAPVVVTVTQQVMVVLEEIDDEEIKHNYKVRAALHNLKLVFEAAYAFLDKVDDVFYYCQSNSMSSVIQELNRPHPNLQSLHDLMDHLGNLLAKAETKYSELVGACNAAIQSCREAEIVCARMEKESRRKKVAARGVGGTAAGATLAGGTAAAAGGVVATGVAASAVAGVLMLGIGAIVHVGLAITASHCCSGWRSIGTAVATHHIASKYAKSAAAFKRICEDFDTLLHFAFSLKEEVAQVHTVLENVAAQVNSILYSVDRTNMSLIRDSVTLQNTVCIA